MNFRKHITGEQVTICARQLGISFSASFNCDVHSEKHMYELVAKASNQAREQLADRSKLFKVLDESTLHFQYIIEQSLQGRLSDQQFSREIRAEYRRLVRSIKPYTKGAEFRKTIKLFKLDGVPRNIWKLRIAAIETASTRYFEEELIPFKYKDKYKSVGQGYMDVHALMREMARIQAWGGYNNIGKALVKILAQLGEEKDRLGKCGLGMEKESLAHFNARNFQNKNIDVFYAGYIKAFTKNTAMGSFFSQEDKDYGKAVWHCGRGDGREKLLTSYADAVLKKLSKHGYRNCEGVYPLTVIDDELQQCKQLSNMQFVACLSKYQIILAGINKNTSVLDNHPGAVKFNPELRDWIENPDAGRYAIIHSIFKDAGFPKEFGPEICIYRGENNLKVTVGIQ